MCRKKTACFPEKERVLKTVKAHWRMRCGWKR